MLLSGMRKAVKRIAGKRKGLRAAGIREGAGVYFFSGRFRAERLAG